MMDAGGYRIGNILRSKQWYGRGAIEAISKTAKGFILTVKGYNHEYAQDVYFDLEDIPLTTEIVKQIGFQEEPDDIFILRVGCFYFRIYKTLGGFRFPVAKHYSIPIESVRDLQNIYYTFARHELETEVFPNTFLTV